jgi:hypothetical protein
MAARDPLDSPPRATQSAILLDGINSVRGAGGVIPACVGRKKGGQKDLISANNENQYALHEQLRISSVEIITRHNRAISCRTGKNFTRSMGTSRFPLKTNRTRAEHGDARSADQRASRSSLKASRINLLSRFLRTALQVRRGTAKPVSNRAAGAFSSRNRHRMSSPSARRPEAYRLPKSSRPRRLSFLFTYRSSLTVSFLRPRARRRARTFRPFLLAMRSRNPCVFFRFLLCG